MKKTNLYRFLVAALCSGIVLTSCEDEVLVPVEDNTKVQELLAQIATAQTSLVTVNTSNNALRVEYGKMDTLLNALYAERTKLNTSATTKVQYTVNVLSAANTVFSSGARENATTGVPGIIVELEQEGKVISATSTEAGAIFTGLKPGYVNVYVNGAAASHTDVEYRAWIGDPSSQDELINAASQIVLFPTAGTSSATIKGKAMINMVAYDDTLGRTYTTDYNDVKLAGTFVNDSKWNELNFAIGFNPSNDNTEGTIFGNTEVREIKFDAMATDKMVIAYPNLPMYINNVDDEGYIQSMTYTGAIKSTKVAADGSYQISVPASARGLNIRLEMEANIIADHTRFTRSANNLGQAVGADLSATGFVTPTGAEAGTGNEVGYSIVDFKDVTAMNSAQIGNGATRSSVKRKAVKEQYKYRPYFVSGGASSADSYTVGVKAGGTTTQNIYLFPDVKQ